MVSNRLLALWQAATSDTPVFPPDKIFNQHWLLGLVLGWFAEQPVVGHSLNFAPGARWFSGGMIPQPFMKRMGSDKRYDTRIPVDAVVGHFNLSAGDSYTISLSPDATQLLVLETRLFETIAEEDASVRLFSTSARSIAGLVETLRRARLAPDQVEKLGFYLLAPQTQIEKGIFPEMARQIIQRQVKHRVDDYAGFQDRWYEDWFLPAFDHVDVQVVSWESVIAAIKERDSQGAAEIRDFYQACEEYTHPPAA